MHRIAVVGAGQFGQNHCRVVRQSTRAELAAVVDLDPARGTLSDYRDLAGKVDAAIVSTPTSAHAEIGGWLLEHGIDVLVEKPIAPDLESAGRLIAAAESHARVLQVGHLERFNPAVIALEGRVTLPLFFEIHRLSVFSPRSLDVDVILDLMIHDIDIVLSLTGAEPSGDPRRGRFHPLAKGGYRQCPPGVSQRLRGEPDGQPGFHRAGAQTAPVPAATICFARLRPPGIAHVLGRRRPPGGLRSGSGNEIRAIAVAIRRLSG